MTAITAAMVKELRERSGAGMMECKKALTAAGGDIDQAMEEMRKSGQAKADKKAGRVAADGLIVIKLSDDSQQAIMVEVNSETDFVARDESFSQFANAVAEVALAQGITEVDALSAAKLTSGETVEEARKSLVQKIGENIQIRRITELKTKGHIGVYVHGGRIGVLVDMQGGDAALAKDIAMQVAASQPLVVAQSDVPADVVAKEKEIFVAQAKESGKPDDIIEKMTSGRINKFLDEVSLLGQPFVKDPSQKISDLLKQNNAKVLSFQRYVLGEGIEKEVTDFAAEVMQQAKL